MSCAGYLVPAYACLGTSSAASMGSEKDTETWQRVAFGAFADRARLAIAATFHDAAVLGEDRRESRPALSALLDWIEGNGVRIVIIEDETRFARELTRS